MNSKFYNRKEICEIFDISNAAVSIWIKKGILYPIPSLRDKDLRPHNQQFTKKNLETIVRNREKNLLILHEFDNEKVCEKLKVKQKINTKMETINKKQAIGILRTKSKCPHCDKNIELSYLNSSTVQRIFNISISTLDLWLKKKLINPGEAVRGKLYFSTEVIIDFIKKSDSQDWQNECIERLNKLNIKH